MTKFFKVATFLVVLSVTLLRASAQNATPPRTPDPVPKKPEPVEKLGDNLFRVGSLRVDTLKREVTVGGTFNKTNVLEFVANTKGGFKSYESALELDTNAVTFNLAMILIGLDKNNAAPSKFHFDPNTPGGDPVEIWAEWKTGSGETRRMRAEELLWDKGKKEKFPRGQWIYTGSIFSADGLYMADVDGVLIGFVHDPSSIIEWSGPQGLGRFGFVEVDPGLGLAAGTRISLVIKAATAAKR